MIINIFYIVGIFFILKSYISLYNFNRTYRLSEWFSNFSKKMGRKPSKDDFRSEQEVILFLFNILSSFFEAIWLLLGLFTKNDEVFLFIIILPIVIKYLMKSIKYTLLHKIITFSLILLNISVYLYLIINNLFL